MLEHRDKLEGDIEARHRLIALIRATAVYENASVPWSNRVENGNGTNHTVVPSHGARIVLPYRSGFTAAHTEACEAFISVLAAIQDHDEAEFRTKLMEYVDSML